ncbi:hypothetical protein Tco_0418997 [Tanacetum coccineum]
MVNTGQREGKPVWDNTKRVNHQNFSKYPHLSKTFIPSRVLIRTGLHRPSVSIASPSISTVRPVSAARPSINTARHVCTARPSINTASPVCTARHVYATRPTYPRMDNVRPRGSCSPIKRPKGNYLDHMSKDSGSFMLKKGNPEILLQDHAVVDSGCSSNMTGNKAYLLDYEDFNRGFVAFGSDPKGDELKFNLFSVSQMCDKKNSVLFTKSECLILSPSFKLLDESQVVLRAPRKDDVYSLDLKNIVPSRGITCLYANAIVDESKLWISMDLRMDRSCAANSTHIWSYSDKHNMVAFLKKPNESVGFTEVVDFLKGTSLRYALTHNPTIYDSLVKQFWQTATVRTLANGTQQLVASIDSKEYTITEASVRSKLQLADATGIHNLSDAEIYAGLATLGYLGSRESLERDMDSTAEFLLSNLFDFWLTKVSTDRLKVSTDKKSLYRYKAVRENTCRDLVGKHEVRHPVIDPIRNEDGLTLQSVYDLCISLCTHVTDQAKEIKHLKAQIKKIKKKAKPIIIHHKAWMKSVALKTRLAKKTSLKKKGVQKEIIYPTGRNLSNSSKGEPSDMKESAFDDLDDDSNNYYGDRRIGPR